MPAAPRPARDLRVGDLVDFPVRVVALSSRGPYVVDRVEHHADDRVGVQQGVAYPEVERPTGIGGQVSLVEQPGLMASPERGETGLLLGLTAGLQLSGEQAGPGDRGHGRERTYSVIVGSSPIPLARASTKSPTCTSSGIQTRSRSSSAIPLLVATRAALGRYRRLLVRQDEQTTAHLDVL